MSEEPTVPQGWTRTTLGDLGRYLNGRAFKTSEWSRSGRPIIRIQDLTGSNRAPNFFEGDVEDRYVVRPGDFLISWSATLGAYIWDGPEAVLNQHIFKVESTIDKRFHYHLVRERINELQRNAHGSGMVHVTKGVFEGTPVIIPDRIEFQAAIAKVLDGAEAKQGAAQQHLETTRRLTDQFRKSVLSAACSGSLTSDWRETHPDVLGVESDLGSLMERRRPRSSKEQPVDLGLPEFPDTYLVATIGDAAVLLEYGTSQRADASPETGIPIIRMGNIQAGKLDLDDLKYCRPDHEIERLLLQEGDVLFNRTNSPELVGKSAVFHEAEPMSFASYLIRVRFHPQVADPDFVNLWINSAWGKSWARLAKTDGVSQSNINGSKLALMPLPLPPIEEQRVIVKRAAAMLEVADGLVDKVERAANRADQTFQAVLAKAFAGELIF